MKLKQFIRDFDFTQPDWSRLPKGFPNCDLAGPSSSEVGKYMAIRNLWELNQPEKPKARSRVWQSTNGYTYLVSWSNASLLRVLVRKFTRVLPRSEYRLKAQLDDAARSTVANIEEGFARATTGEYLNFLGYSQGSLKEVKGDIQRLGQSVGQLYAANTLGGIGGSLVAGFLLIPLMGVQKGIWLMASLYFLVGLGFLFFVETEKWVKVLGTCLAALILLLGIRISPWNKHFLISGPYANWRYYVNNAPEQAAERMQASELLYYKDGLEATVAVKKSGEQIFLRINGKTDAATGLDMDTQILLGELPMVLHPKPEDVLVIGLGSGITLGSVEQHPLRTVEAVEIEPAVVEAAQYFSEANLNALEDKRLKLVVGDARNYLLANPKKYDIITAEPSNPYLSGSAKLFTKEYFNLIKSRLKENGLAVQWIHLYSLETTDLKMVLRTFQEVFPHTTVWDNLSSYDLLLVGSQEPLEISASLIEQKMAMEKVRADLTRIFIETPEQFLSYLALDAQGVEQFTQGARENTDNHPLLEFSAPKTLYQATISKNLESLLGLRPDLGGDNAQFRRHVVLAKMYFTRGENEKAISKYEEALKIDPKHPWVKLTLGPLYLEMGQQEIQKGNADGVEKSFARAAEIDPENPQAHFYLGVLYKIQGKTEEAKRELETSLSLNPHQPEVEKMLEEL